MQGKDQENGGTKMRAFLKGKQTNDVYKCALCGKEGDLKSKIPLLEERQKDMVNNKNGDFKLLIDPATQLVQLNHRLPKKVEGESASAQGACEMVYHLQCFQEYIINQARKYKY